MAGPQTFVGQRRLALFEEQRPRLMGIAYRILGAVTDADDVLAATWKCWSAVDLTAVEDSKTVLTTMVTGLSLDRLRRERTTREGYAGSWLPEPVACRSWADDPATDSEPDDSLSLAALAAMEALSPLERAAFVLRVVFACPYADVASALGRSEPAVRQLVHRAKAHLGEARVRHQADRTRHEVVLRRLLSACRSGSLAPLLAVLAPEVVLVNDAGTTATAPPRPVAGRDHVGRFLVSVLRRLPRGAVADVEPFNGTTGIVVRAFGDPVRALAIRVDGDQVASLQLVAAPRKLRALRAPVAPTAII